MYESIHNWIYGLPYITCQQGVHRSSLKCSKEAFNSSTQTGIKSVIKKENTCVIAIVVFYETRTTNPMKVCRVLSCVVYYVVYNYVCIEYLGCQYKKLSVLCSDKISEYRIYNE